MNKDKFFELAVTLASGSFEAPLHSKQVSMALIQAYNAVLDAYSKIPDSGPVPTP
ncbi:MAG TPA: hypothetical protein VEG25_08250 [Burkholderiales bacterium]|nr:hypothetical protein [Burkholderiales bacterium]